MKIPWKDPRCILCLQEGALTSEHVIPQVLGGRLQAEFLCATCNSRLGTALDARVKSDPRIRKAALELRHELPGLAEAIEDGAPYFGKTTLGEFQGRVKNGVFRSEPLIPGDGSLILATPLARDAIKQMLMKQGRGSEIPSAIERFDGAPPNERIEIAPGIQVIDWQTEQVRPALELGETIPDAWPLKVAYAFLACCVGGAIYSGDFEIYRRLLLGDPSAGDAVLVEHLVGEHLAPLHGLLLEPNAPHAIVQMRVFRRICYRVHFRRIAVGGPRLIYSHDLAQPAEEFAIIEHDGEEVR